MNLNRENVLIEKYYRKIKVPEHRAKQNAYRVFIRFDDGITKAHSKELSDVRGIVGMRDEFLDDHNVKSNGIYLYNCHIREDGTYFRVHIDFNQFHFHTQKLNLEHAVQLRDNITSK